MRYRLRITELSRGYLLLLLLGILTAGDVRNLVRQGNSHYHRQRFDQALSLYEQAEVLEPDNLGIHYNLGNTYYRLNRHREAAAELSLATVSRNPKIKAQASYNLGNVFYRAGQLDAAINAYKQALLVNPRDRKAKENLEFCLKKKQEQGQQPDSTGQQQPSHRNQPEDQSQPQPQPQARSGAQMDQEQAKRLLQAIQNKEKETQRQARRPRTKRQVDKDW